MTEIGLFPLGIVLVPGEQEPLHIFEERYRELIGECLDKDQEFGLVLTDDAGLRSVGTRAAVSEVLQRLPDGRMNILVEGGDRFRIVELTTGRSFQTADVEALEDLPDDDATTGEVADCLRAYQELVDAADAEAEELDLEADSLAFHIAGRIDFAPEIKQELLESRSERERVVRLTEALSEAAKMVRIRRFARERAAGNGEVVSSDE
jgi:Lon protease-like protein